MSTAFAALMLAAAAPAATSVSASYDALPRASFSWGRQYDVVSRTNGRAYRIYVHVPHGTPPKAGWPVVYASDGYIAFPSLAAQMALRNAAVGEGIVVAIGYPQDEQSTRLRFRDLTFSVDPAVVKAPLRDEDVGGGEAFYHFIVDELQPEVDARFGGDKANSALVGYSLGGLFNLHILFKHPNAFRTFVIGSPSIWWKDREVLALEDGFAQAVRAGTAAPRVLITADAWEQGDRNPAFPKSGPERAAMLALSTKARMVDNARELSERLARLPGKAPYEVRYALFPDTDHNDGIPLSLHSGLSFIFAR